MSKIPAFWQEKYKKEAAKNWNLFYKRNEARFFKDRHWIGREFPELFDPQIEVATHYTRPFLAFCR
jgi:methyltransferase-like protein 6